MKRADEILCHCGKKLTNNGQHCEKSIIGCIRSCVYRPENQPENWQFKSK